MEYLSDNAQALLYAMSMKEMTVEAKTLFSRLLCIDYYPLLSDLDAIEKSGNIVSGLKLNDLLNTIEYYETIKDKFPPKAYENIQNSIIELGNYYKIFRSFPNLI